MLDQVLQVDNRSQKKATFGSARNFLREKHPDNSPILVFLQVFNIKVCFGCKKQCEVKMRTPPHGIICKRLVTKDRLINISVGTQLAEIMRLPSLVSGLPEEIKDR